MTDAVEVGDGVYTVTKTFDNEGLYFIKHSGNNGSIIIPQKPFAVGKLSEAELACKQELRHFKKVRQNIIINTSGLGQEPAPNVRRRDHAFTGLPKPPVTVLRYQRYTRFRKNGESESGYTTAAKESEDAAQSEELPSTLCNTSPVQSAPSFP